MHVALRMQPPPPTNQVPQQKMLEAPHQGRAHTVSESVNGSEANSDEQVPMPFWDPLQAAIIDASYSALPGKGLVDLLGQGHYADFGGRVGPDFVF